MTQETPGQRIERARLLRHWSQEELAAHLETSRQSVYRWEHDEALPTLKMRGTLINLLGLPKDVFLSKKEPQTKSQEKASLPPSFPSPEQLAAYLQHLSPTLCFKGWRKTKRLENGLVNLTYVTLNEYPLPFSGPGVKRFDWGYKGSGTILARSILEAYFEIHKDEEPTGHPHTFEDMRFFFEKEVVEKLPLEQWELSSEQIHDWLEQRRK
jgi:transcriptional regulator with XRE-family HTH domain